MLSIAKKALIVIDYDKTMVEYDSDDGMLEKVGYKFEKPVDIDQIVDGIGYIAPIEVELTTKYKVSVEKQRSIMEEIPSVEYFPDFLKYLLQEKEMKFKNCEFGIVSGSNTLYIEWYLERNKVSKLIDKIIANPSYVDEKTKFFIQKPYHENSCKYCTKNMCKQKAMKDMLAIEKKQFEKILYIGDGKFDFCTCSQMLTGKDIIFARKGFKLEKMLQSSKDNCKATVNVWANGKELQKSFENLLI